MRYRKLGRTGIDVSVHCLGTMMFGAMGRTGHDDCIRMIHAALGQGINFIDTADIYSAGESEQIVGKALRGRRDDVVLATKVHFKMGEGRNRGGNSRRWILKAVDDGKQEPFVIRSAASTRCDSARQSILHRFVGSYSPHRPRNK